MGTATVVVMSPSDIQSEFQSLMVVLGMSLESAEELASANALTPDQFAAWSRILDLTWLLTDDSSE